VGLWLKNEDGFVPVSGGGGSFDGEHVLTGDPDSPPEGWAVGQLLYDGLEDAAGDAGPHDHDYLPLEGGAVTGDLQVDGQTLAQSGTAALPGIAFTSSAWSGFYYDASTIHTSVQGQSRLQVGVAGTKVTGDLQVDGQVSFGVTSAGDWPLKLYDGSPTYFHGIGVGVNSLTFHVGESLAAELGPGGWAFGITEGIDTRDVLERAETATMPAPEEAGVDGLTVNEVVTALLLKVKELSADIKELKGN